jgi:hypothetical protein
MHGGLEFPKPAGACSLWGVLDAVVPQRYWLRPPIAAYLLSRGKVLNPPPAPLPECISCALPTGYRWDLCRLAHSSVRALTPTECERLMGFPAGWTLPA